MSSIGSNLCRRSDHAVFPQRRKLFLRQAKTRKNLVVVGAHPEPEKAATSWLVEQLAGKTNREQIIDVLLQAWWVMRENKSFSEIPSEDERRKGWHETTKDRVLEIGWLDRNLKRPARFVWLAGDKFASN